MMYGPETVTVEAFIRHLKRMTPNPRTSPMDSELKSAIERLRRLRDEVRGIIVDEMTGDMRLLVSDADDAAKRIAALLHASATPRSAVESGFAAADNNQETWRPISDAPTTGVRIVATNPLWPEDRRVRVVWWVEHGPSQDEGQYWQDDDDSEPDPTLWQPLDTFATPSPQPDGADKDELTDLISDAISDSMDMDWSSRDGARAVVAALIKENIVRIKQ